MLGELFAKITQYTRGTVRADELGKGHRGPSLGPVDVRTLNIWPITPSRYRGVGRPDLSNDFGSPFGHAGCLFMQEHLMVVGKRGLSKITLRLREMRHMWDMTVGCIIIIRESRKSKLRAIMYLIPLKS